MSPASPCAKSPTWDLLIVSTGGSPPVPVANVAATVSAPAGILNAQVAPDAVHAVGVPVHPLNVAPTGAVSVKVTAVLNAMLIAQPVVVGPGPQLMPPPVTVPPATPERFTVSRKLLFVKTAVALVAVVLLTTNAQVGAVVSLHGPAVQLLNEYPVAGVAVKLTDVPEAKFAEHAVGGAGFAQSISGVTAGVEVLVIVPLPVNATVKLLVCAVNSAVTVFAAPIVTTHFAGCPVGTTHGPLQPVKFDVPFAIAVSVVIDPLNIFCVQTPVGVVTPFNTH